MIREGNARPCLGRPDLGQDGELPREAVKLPNAEPDQRRGQQGGKRAGQYQPPPALGRPQVAGRPSGRVRITRQ
ncbi:MAG TPA: hypothetical protein VMF62_06670 [Acetobacteraceae bacterium]|jgi:hypothetical protein|nr:hypothetical protein [Acetobacteraceae bacterium]